MTTTSQPTPDLTALLETRQEALRCPHLYFAAQRESAPVSYSPDVDAYVVTRYEDVMAVLRDHETFSSVMPTGPKMTAQMMAGLQETFGRNPELGMRMAASPTVAQTAVLLNADPPAHDRQRALVNRAFSPRRVRQLEDSIGDVAQRLVDGFSARGSCEFVSEFAVGLPLTVIAGALGVPTEDMAMFKRWSDAFVVAIGNHRLDQAALEHMLVSQLEFFDYFTAKIEQRTAEPRDDLITDVVQARVDGAQPLTLPEMLLMLSQFLVAGNETTTKLLASAMLLLCRDPSLVAALREEPGRIPDFVEEVLRLEAPVQGLFRTAVRDAEVGGVPVPAGSHLWLVYASANRDPDEFAEPDDVVFGRENGRAHLSFGQGIHYCLGASLARAEARIGIATLLERLDGFRLATDEELDYEESYALHGLKALPLEFAVRA